MKQMLGFTLIEIMIALLLAAIVLTVGMPSLRDFIHNNQAASETNALLAALNSARGAAVERGIPVAVCASSNGTSCLSTSGCTGATDWSGGWLIFVDNPGGTACVKDSSDVVLRVGAGFSDGSLKGTVAGVQYLPSGLRLNTTTATFTLKLGKQTRIVTLTPSGQASSQ
jgi:type IV fimbrial biogenesis protein FimT